MSKIMVRSSWIRVLDSVCILLLVRCPLPTWIRCSQKGATGSNNTCVQKKIWSSPTLCTNTILDQATCQSVHQSVAMLQQEIANKERASCVICARGVESHDALILYFSRSWKYHSSCNLDPCIFVTWAARIGCVKQSCLNFSVLGVASFNLASTWSWHRPSLPIWLTSSRRYLLCFQSLDSPSTAALKLLRRVAEIKLSHGDAAFPPHKVHWEIIATVLLRTPAAGKA